MRMCFHSRGGDSAPAPIGRGAERHVRAPGVLAFTLMEVMIGMVASALVLVAVNGVFFGAIRLRNTTERAVEEALPMHRALNLIRQDLSGIVMPGGTFATEFQTTPTISGSSTNTNSVASATGTSSGSLLSATAMAVGPEFRTATGVLRPDEPWGDVQRVAYFLGETTNRMGRGHDLYRSVSRNLLPPMVDTPVIERLIGGVETVTLLYHDGSEWKDTWDSTTDEPKMPLAIKVSISLMSPTNSRTQPLPIELVVPLLLEARTNQTETATAGEGGQP